MLEMYIAGVSTRKVSCIVEQLCGKNVSKSFVSSLTKQLDESVVKWQYRSLINHKYPYIIADVIYLKVRQDNKVVSKSCHIAIGIANDGKRQILGFLIQDEESEDTWDNFFIYLKDRGLKDVKMVISDAHKGLVNAIKKNFIGSSWQRCQVHFLRNIFSKIAKKNTKEFREEVKSIFKVTDIKTARKLKAELIEKYGKDKKYEKACNILDEGFEDAFAYLSNDVISTRLRTSNAIERLNEEIRRREKVIRIFPNKASANRLIGAMLMDKHEEWISSPRTYINI